MTLCLITNLIVHTCFQVSVTIVFTTIARCRFISLVYCVGHAMSFTDVVVFVWCCRQALIIPVGIRPLVGAVSCAVCTGNFSARFYEICFVM
jgi:hypothetical protein